MWILLFIFLLATSSFSATVDVVTIITKDEMGMDIPSPSDIYYDPAGDEIYAVIPGKNKIVVYSSDYFPVASLGRGRGLRNPVGVTVDRNGNVYVCEGSPPRIVVFNAAFFKIKEIALKGFKGCEGFIPKRIAVGPDGRIFVAGSGVVGLLVFDNEGKYLGSIVPVDSVIPGKEENATIDDVAIDSKGNIYMISEYMGRGYVYDYSGSFLFKFGMKGGSSGKLSRPEGIAIDEVKKRIFVVDYMRHTISIYSLIDGRYIDEFGGLGWLPGWFCYPTDVEVDGRGNVIVSDNFNKRIQVLKVEPGIMKVK